MPAYARTATHEPKKHATGLVSVDGRTFPLVASRLGARAAGGIALSTLIQEYENPYQEPLEILYTLPLPADGAVIGYTFTIGARVVTGRIERREEAEEIYRRALEEGRAAGILEQERADTFTQRLGSLPPGVPIKVEIGILHPLSFLAAGVGQPPLWEFRFPTVLGVRYMGGEGRVPDASALEPPRADGQGTPVRLEAGLLLEDGSPERLGAVSPSHAIDVMGSGGAAHVTLSSPSRLDRDLVVRWRACEERVGVSVLEGPGLPGDPGRYALLTVTPPAAPSASFPRDLTIILDASGSMSGAPIRQAKSLVVRLLEGLAPEDRFELLAFSNETVRLSEGFVPASPENIAAARRRLAALEASGGTEMVTALEQALQTKREGAQRQAILITDGYVGFESDVIARILEAQKHGARLHTVGVGSAVNRTLTRSGARAGRGIELIVAPDEDAGAAANRLGRATERPVLVNVTVRGSAVENHAPHVPRDVLAGSPVQIFVEVKPEGGTIEITGRLAGTDEPWEQHLVVGASAPEGAGHGESIPSQTGAQTARTVLPLGAIYGRERVEDVETVLSGSLREDVFFPDHAGDQIETLGLRHKIVTRRTSLIAVSEDPTVDPSDPRRCERLAVEVPQDVSAEGVGLSLGGYVVAYQVPPGRSVDSYSSISSGKVFEDWRSRHPLDTSGWLPGEAIESQDEPADRLAGGGGGEFRGPFPELPARTPVEPSEPRIEAVKGRVVRIEKRYLLVVEFEAPAAGVEVPPEGHELTIDWISGPSSRGSVVGTISTRPGLHGAGLTVRLGVFSPGARWEGGRYVPSRIRWMTAGGGEFRIDLQEV